MVIKEVASKRIASLTALLCRAKLCLAIGRALSQLDAPFSLAISTDCFCSAGSIASNSVTEAVSIALCWLRARFFS